MTTAPETATRLDELLTAIRGWDDPRRATSEWKQVFRLLQKTELPSGRVTAVVGMRDVAGLAELISQLLAEDTGPQEDAPDPETCKQAMKAFRKRLVVTRLDEESTLGRGPLSKGADGSDAIVPPREWPQPVWDELVHQGSLQYIGHGFYKLGK